MTPLSRSDLLPALATQAADKSPEALQEVRVTLTNEKRAELNVCSFEVRIKGLEPPRLSASDPKSDVATNYTISALGLAKV